MDVAKEAGYSYYHFTRMFQALLGESIGNYVQKRRLFNGASQLLYSNRKIIDIALDCGFDSPEAFSRAFKSVYRVSPKEYRKNRLEVFIGHKKEMGMDLIKHITEIYSQTAVLKSQVKAAVLLKVRYLCIPSRCFLFVRCRHLTVTAWHS